MGCVGLHTWLASDWPALAGVAIFALGGLVIGADREKCIAGVRRENLFHYVRPRLSVPASPSWREPL